MEIGKVSSALSPSMSTTCSVINTVSSYLFSGTPFSVDTLDCSEDKVSNTYFNGSQALANNLTDLNILPFVQQGMYFCGIADAGGATVDATLPALGGFGISSRFDVTKRDPPNTRVVGRRTGTLKLFGIAAKLEAQDIDWTLPVEKTPNGQTYGSYAVVTGDGMVWNFKGTVTFPFGNVLLSLTPELHTRSNTGSMTNGGLKFSRVSPNPPIAIPDPNSLNSGFFYSNWENCAPCPQSKVDPTVFRLQ